ncbi:MAG: arsenical pump-driving ATPase [Candidatus Obscuribacterales bacterium]|nr:arsenical pump-driving ATPase [Candidatus Obscuribacterales bacterium]
MNLFEQATRYMFFTGKGGVGKTSVSCAIAIVLADAGKRVLLVSTDPASNLDEVLHVELGSVPIAVPGVTGLDALNIDPEASARDYRERLLGPYRGLLPEASLKSMEEQLSGSCTTEIAAFDEFARFLGDAEKTANYDHVIFDTAPTGHTMRLLSLPKSWSNFIEDNTTGTSCLGPLAGLQQQQDIYASSVRTLMDGARTTLVLVARAEQSALREAARTSVELRDIGVKNQCLVLNGVLKHDAAGDAVASAFASRGQTALASMPKELAELPTQEIPLNAKPLLGVEALRAMLKPGISTPAAKQYSSSAELPPPLLSIVDELEKSGKGVIMTMGKGGVGKTSIAAAIAVELARRGNPVHLSTTDPAAHVAWVVENPVPLLTISRIDPGEETKAYQDEVMQSAGANLDAQGRALLDEDLRSPCTEEVAVFRSFANVVAEGQSGFVVLDTAPTGHTILLLDAAQAYHKEVLRQSSHMPDSVINLLPRLRDRAFTRILIVTLPEATPVHEAKRLQEDLARAHIHPFAWIINQSLSPVKTSNDVLAARQQNERQYIDEVKQLAGNCQMNCVN